MLALGLLRTLNRFRLYLQEATAARKDVSQTSYDTNQIDVGIAWHFSFEYVHSSEELKW